MADDRATVDVVLEREYDLMKLQVGDGINSDTMEILDEFGSEPPNTFKDKMQNRIEQ